MRFYVGVRRRSRLAWHFVQRRGRDAEPYQHVADGCTGDVDFDTAIVTEDRLDRLGETLNIWVAIVQQIRQFPTVNVGRGTNVSEAARRKPVLRMK